MSRSNPTKFDNERSSRLKEERKKIFNSRREFGELTKIPTGTLEGWELRNTNISCEGLKELDEHGIDIYYIITGKRTQDTSANDEIESTVYDKLIEQFEGRVEALERENELLREKLESTSDNSDLVKIAEKAVEIYEQRRTAKSAEESAG